ncbi:MAG: hypothetical protein HY066_05110 [Betaproteobacteria bacterium]|nr:hypothetical protein [Betaproteobacteria bacterium]
MFEYQFFDDHLRDRYLARAASLGVACEVSADQIAGSVVAVSEEIAEAAAEELDALYDTLMQEQAVLAGQNQDWVAKRLAGFQVTLSDGLTHTVRLDADNANRLLANFTPAEAQQLVEAIARSLENPLDGPLCNRFKA